MSIKVGKSFKALIAAGAALVMAASMAACGPSAGTPSEAKSSDTGTSSSANAKARSLDEIKKSGKIKIAVFSDKAPFGYVDKDGKYQGYDVYFAEQLAKDLGVEPEYTSVDPAARVDVLTSNKVDLVLANFTVTDERKEKVDFAKPYMKVALGVVSPESAQITDVSQLDGKTLIIAKGTTAETWFEKNAPNVKLQKYDQYADAYNALLDGRGDAFSTDNTEVLAWAKSNKGFKVGITHLGDDDTIAPAVQKGNTELLNFVNDEIVKLGKDNFFHKDYQETLEPVYGNEVNPDDIVVEGGAVVFCLLKHCGIAGRVVLRTGSKAVEVEGRDRVERHGAVRGGGQRCIALLRPAAAVGVTQLQHQLGRVAVHAHRVGVDLHIVGKPGVGRDAQSGGERHHNERDVGTRAVGAAAGDDALEV